MKALLLTASILVYLITNLNAQIPNYVPSNGIIGWWPFSGNANDESGNNNNGIVSGATLSSDRFGSPLSAYSFDGFNDDIKVNRTSMSSFSISIWYYLDINTHYSPIVDAYNANWEILIEYLNTTFVKWVTSPTVYNELFVGDTNSLGQWHHMVCTYSNNQVKMYKNGILKKTFNTVTFPMTNGNFYFGRSTSGTSQYLDGKLDDIGIWNRPLTPEEVNILYSGCQLSVVSQPQNAINYAGLSTYFSTSSSVANSSYQWQTKLNNIFVDISNGGQFQGAQDDTLYIYFLSLLNDGQEFRCIISSGNCRDTSNIAILNVKEGSGIEGLKKEFTYNLYPNPASGLLNFSSTYFDQKRNLELYNSLGEKVITEEWATSSQQIDIKPLPSGVYFFKISGDSSMTKIIKM